MGRKPMILSRIMTRVAARLTAIMVLALAPLAPAQAQPDGFAPAAFVNGRVISQYELRQRVLFLTLLHQPGDIETMAMSSLIDDALRRDAAKKLDLKATTDDVKAGMAEFASRTKLSLDDFEKALTQGGVDPETLRDFVEAGVLWRAVIRTKFAATTKISDAEIDRAIAAGAASGGEMRVLLSEIVLPTGGTQDAMALARRLKLTATTIPSFAMAAQNYSKAPTAGGGGALNWASVSALPREVAPQILALKVGEVTEPIAVQGAVELFQLRDLSQGSGDPKGAAQIDYAQFFAPAGSDLATIAARLDTCDDLYTIARGLPPEALQRATVPEAGLPPALRAVIVGLDPGETRIVATTNGAPSLVMLCDRTPFAKVAASRDDVGTTILNNKLSLLAGAYLEELRSNAFIRYP